MGVSFFKKTNLFLGVIILLAILLRFWRLGDVPVGFHRDEAFLGFNAYSILQTGKDISGNFLPWHLKSFLYSPAGYSYFSIPFIKFFDLDALSVRFPSAFFGTLTVLITYFLVKRLFLFHKLSRISTRINTNTLAIFSAFFLAISPWHINLSRTATENVLVVFFISLGVLLFLIWREKQKWYLLLLSFLSFGITLFIYQASRVFVPMLIPLMTLCLLKTKLTRQKFVPVMVLFILAVIVPLFTVLFSKELSLRLRTVSIFATAETQLVIDEQIREDGVSNIQMLLTRIFHNKPLVYTSQVVESYFKHFSFDFLFTDKGFPDRYRIPHAGLLYLFELPLLLVGIWKLLQKYNKTGLFLIGWVILAPIGTALTFDDVPNLQRTLIIFPALSIVEGVGLFSLSPLFKVKHVGIPLLIIGGTIISYSFLFYIHQYYVHGPLYRAWYRHDGYKELVEKVNKLLPDYEKVHITNHESAPTIFFLFFTKYNPHLFQEETKESVMRDFDRIGFGKYEFIQEECPLKEFEEQDSSGQKHIVSAGKKEILYVNFATCPIVMNKGKMLDEIKRSDGSTVFRVFRIKE